MANRIKGITIEIEGNSTKLQDALKGVNKKLQETQSDLKEVDKLLKINPENVELLQQKQKLLADAVQQTSEKLKTEKDALDQLKNGPQTEETIRQQEALTREIIDTDNQLDSLTKQYEEFGAQAEQQTALAAEKMKAAGEEIRKTGEKMSSIGSTLTKGVTAPITAVGGVAIASAVNFEDAMAKVSTIADETEMSLEDMQVAIMELSDQTGISASEIADNVYNAISAGQKTRDAVNFVGKAAMLAKAGFTDSASALDILTTTMNAYNMEASEVTRVSDVLIKTQNLGKTTVGELASTMGKVIPTAKSNGVQLESLAGAYAVMTSNGIATAETTTYLNSMLNELGKKGTAAANAFAEGTDHIKEGGLTMAEAMEMGWGLTDVLSILNEQAVLSGTSIQNMFGSAEAGKAANVLWDNSAKLNDAIDQMGAAAGSTETAFEKLDTTSYKAQKALNQLKNTGIEVGTILVEMLQPALEMLSEGVTSLKTWWDSLDESQQKMIIKCAGIAAAAGPVIAIAGKGIEVAGSLVSAGSGLISSFANISGKLGGLAQGAGSAVDSMSNLGGAAASAAGPMGSAGGSMGALSANAKGLIAAGAGILMVSAGIALLAQSAIAVSEAGAPAAVAMGVMVGAVALMAAGAAALAPALTAGAVGFVAFGAGITLVGAGILAATGGIAILAAQLPTISEHGAGAAEAVGRLAVGMVAFGAGAVAGGAGSVALAAGLLSAAAGLTAAGAGAVVATAGMVPLSVALATVSAEMLVIESASSSAAEDLQSMVSAVDVVESGLSSMESIAKEVIGSIVSVFEGAPPSIRSAADGVAQSMNESMARGMVVIAGTVQNGMTVMRAEMNFGMQSTLADLRKTLRQMEEEFRNVNFTFSRNIALPHFKINGGFNVETGAAPSVSVSWYRKAYDNAYILSNPTIFGQMNGKYLGGGEGSRSEMIVGTEKLMSMIREAGGQRMDGDIIIPVYIGNEMIDEKVVNVLNRNNYRSGGR